MKKVVRLTEKDMTRLVKKIVKEYEDGESFGYDEDSDSVLKNASEYIDKYFQEEIPNYIENDKLKVFEIIDEMKLALRNWERMYTHAG